MSEVNGTIEKKDTYLQHVSLKNYKSIKNLEIDFKPGLNIIIGKNASGKTNFVNGLNAVLTSDFKNSIDLDAYIKAWVGDKKVEIKIKSANEDVQIDRLSDENYFRIGVFEEPELKIDDESVKIQFHNALYTLSNLGISLKSVLIRFGNGYKENSPFVTTAYSFVFFNNGKASNEWTQILNNDHWTQFIFTFFFHLQEFIFKRYSIENETVDKQDKLKNKIIAYSKDFFAAINDNLLFYSPIEEIRINPNFNIVIDSTTDKEIITNLYLEFRVEKSWLTFNLLSDGTKRLFYIISELLSIPSTSTVNEAIINGRGSVLIEEPELGIHPHQLHLLMQFLREQSRYKQIIITTHSPQVLDTLEPDELDRIIICSHDPKNGTQLDHLSDKQINKASKYMKAEAFLSDYWRFSDLEPA